MEKPPKPEQLVGALQDPVHKDLGKFRPAKASRPTLKKRTIRKLVDLRATELAKGITHTRCSLKND